MDFSIESVVNKLILVLVCVSVLIAVGGGVFYYFSSESPLNYTIPFGVGVLFALVSNVSKALLLKRAILKVTQKSDVNSAKIYFSIQYFLRMAITGVALILAALIPDNIVSLVGAAIGVFAHPIAMHILRIFIPTDAAMAVASPDIDINVDIKDQEDNI